MAKKKPGKRITKKAVQDAERVPVPEITPSAEPEDGAWDADGLTVKRLMFAKAYVGEAGGNASKAAEMAGYRSDNRISLAVTAHKLLNDPHVSRAIAIRLATSLANMDGDALRGALSRLAHADLANFVTVDADGCPRLDFLKARDAAAIGQLREFKAEGIVDPAGGPLGGLRPFKVSIKTHDPKPAIELLAKMAGLLIDRKDITSGGKPLKAYLDIDDGDDPDAAT